MSRQRCSNENPGLHKLLNYDVFFYFLAFFHYQEKSEEQLSLSQSVAKVQDHQRRKLLCI